LKLSKFGSLAAMLAKTVVVC